MRQFIPCHNYTVTSDIDRLYNKDRLHYFEVASQVNGKKKQFYVVGSFGQYDDFRVSIYFDKKEDAIKKMYEMEAEYFG